MRQVILYLGPPTKECRDMLKPIKLPEIYDVDINALKYRPPQSNVIIGKEQNSGKILINGEAKKKQLKNKKYY